MVLKSLFDAFEGKEMVNKLEVEPRNTVGTEPFAPDDRDNGRVVLLARHADEGADFGIKRRKHGCAA